MMSNEPKNIKLDCLTPQTQLNLSGVKMGISLRDTLKINSHRIDKNSGEFLTPTKIIFNYVRYVNETQLKGVDDKNKYIQTAKNLLKELKECGFEVGEEWRGKNSHKLPYAKGNNKLSKDTVIFNVSPSSLCISKNLGLCEVCGVCYALSNERRYINTLIYRLTQLVRFHEMSVDEIVNQFKRLRVFRFLRINESGDLFNLGDFFKVRQIAVKLWELKGVITYFYTHRRDLWDDIKPYQTHYLKINRSGVDFITKHQIHPNHSHLFCDGECEKCIFCKIELNIPIDVLYHGDIDGEDLRDDETILRDTIIKNVSWRMFEDGFDEREIEECIKYLLSNPHNVDEFDGEWDMDLIREFVCVYLSEEDGWEMIYPSILSSEFIWRYTAKKGGF